MKKSQKRDLFVFFGPPGAGKTVQANFLKDRMNVHYVSWGRISRDIVAGKGDHKKFQKRIIGIMEREENFPPNFINKILEQEIHKLKGSNPVLIDGYPRRIEEARELVSIINNCDLNLRALVKFNINFEELRKRIEGRMYCGICGRFYNKLRPSLQHGVCDVDGSVLEKRWDDDVEKSKARFEEYLREALEAYSLLIPYAESSFDVDASQEENFLFAEILYKLKQGKKREYQLYKKIASANLPTKYGNFTIVGYQNKVDYSYHLVLIKGGVKGKRNVPVRIHSSCITGDIFGSSKCDCGDQLHRALEYINKKECGVLIYLFQEGRGINILNKIMAYDLQDKGLDTVEANEELKFPPEMREYDMVDDILRDLGIKSIDIITNNPDKFEKLHSLGIIIEERIPMMCKVGKHNKRYIEIKIKKMGHKIEKQ